MEWIERIFGWLNGYRSPHATLHNLEVKLEDLICIKDDVEEVLQDAVSSGKKPKRVVTNWMRRATEVIMDSQNIQEEASRMGWVAQIVNIPMTNRMEELIKQLVDLSEQRVLQDGLTLDTIQETRALKFRIPRKLAGLAFVKEFDQIWACLVQGGVLSIGIHGLSGVGKTTLAKSVFNKALGRGSPFLNVLWIDSSTSVNNHELQVAIAKQLHLDFSHVDDEAARATLLSKTLKRKRECLVFLDGMCDDISPEDVGIPLKKSRCRLIVTSRSVDIPMKMGCEEIIKVEPVVKIEDWSLSMEKLGGGRDLDTEIQRIDIVQKRSSVPLAVIVMATSVGEVKDICEWKNTLNELEKSSVGELNEMEKKVVPALKLSFDRLNDNDQQCFLMATLLDTKPIFVLNEEELVYYLIGTGSIRRTQDWTADFHWGCYTARKLIGLLKEHDMMLKVSEMANHEKRIENLKMACLLLDHKIASSQLGASPICPKLQTLVCCGKTLSYIPESFFTCMPALGVLNLSSTSVQYLPNSVSGLKNLTTLLLKDCHDLKYVPSLAELHLLKCLNLSKSGITTIPHGMERLVNLIYLNLDELVQLPMFPLGILPKLAKLEYLKVSQHLTIEGKELEGLKRLSHFSGSLSGLHSYSSYVMSRQCQGPRYHYYFKFQRECYVHEEYDYHTNHPVVTIACRISKRGRLPIVLPKDVGDLRIQECKTMTSLCDVPSLENAMDLKNCSIFDCEDVSHIACFSSSCHLCRSHIFQKLEELYLNDLPQLTVLFGFDHINHKASRPVVAPGTFSCLRELFILDCPKIKNLLQPELLPYLENLEELKVEKCKGLKEIIPAAARSDVNCSTTEYSLPSLRSLKLDSLPNLKSIFGGRMSCESLEEIGIRHCPKLKRINLSPPSSLQSIMVGGEDGEEWWASVEWDTSSVKNDLQCFVDYQDTLLMQSERCLEPN